jgi:hypothetical protein
MEVRGMRKLLLWVLGLGMALAQQLSPQGIIVNPVPTDLQVKVWVDKDPGKRGNAVYRIGEPIFIYVSVNQDAYVYLFNINADGRIDPILPNAFERDNFLRAGETRRYPPAGARYRYTVTGPEGEDRILAVASKRPLSIQEILDVEGNRVRVQGAEGLARALSIIVEPLPPRDWVTDVARYYVGRITAPAQATLVVDSRPTGAEVYVDGRLQGRTPLRLTLNEGTYRVELRLPGYEPYQATVRVERGRETRLVASLRPIRTGELYLEARPEGAEVYVDGRLVGRAPLRVSLEAGLHEVRVVAPGYGEYRAQVEVRPGESLRLVVELVPVRAILELYLNVEARVFLDGQEVGVARGGYLRLEAPFGDHELTLVAPGYRTLVQTLRVTGNQVLRLELRPL